MHFRRLYLSEDAAQVSAQLQGEPLSLAQVAKLRDDVSTDEITPVAILSVYDARLGDYAHTGFTAAGVRPIAKGAMRQAGIKVLVAGARYGKGSSREHSPAAERLAGVEVVFAKSFERLYRQNADNIGLITSDNFALLQRLEAGEDYEAVKAVLLAEREGLAGDVLRAGGLLPWGQVHLQAPAEVVIPKRPMTLVEKIIARRVVWGSAAGGGISGGGIFVRPDMRFIHEYYTGMADTLIKANLPSGFKVKAPESVVVFEDHSAYLNESPAHAGNGLVVQMQQMNKAQHAFVAHHGLTFYRTRPEEELASLASLGSLASDTIEGISHALIAERYARPGMLIVGTDSHTPHSGALGAFAYGVGTTDMANAFATEAVRLSWPESIKVNLSGRLGMGVASKDLVLHLLALPFIKAGGAIGKVFEFAGEGVECLSIDERATLCNMTAELGGLTGIVAPDAATVAFIKERRGEDISVPEWLYSDPEAHYAHTLEVDLNALTPMLARPGDPGNGVAVSALSEAVKVDIAYGGSCTAGKRDDFDAYHEVLAWGMARGMKPKAQVFLQYGTSMVRDYARAKGYEALFQAAGIRLLQASCGACANCGPGVSTDKAQVTISAINRNFPGRSGPGQVWLASPATVMASALAGEIVSFEALKRRVG